MPSIKIVNSTDDDTSDGSEEYATNTSLEDQRTEEQTWNGRINGVEAVNIILIIVTVWILICVVAYGTKTRRWVKRARDSSLNNGVIFIACFIAIFMALPRLALTETLYRVHDFSDFQCEVMGDVSKGAFALSSYSVYTFLWIKQRLIFNHPYVKDRVSKCVNMFSRAFIALLTLIFLGVTSIYVIPMSYKQGQFGCGYAAVAGDQVLEKTERSILLAVVWVILEVSVLALFIYPAVQVRKKTREELGLNEGDHPKNFCASRSNNFLNRIVPNDSYVCNNPIQMSINRIVICSIVIVVSDLAAVVIDVTAVPTSAPLVIGQSLYDISSLINAFCMLATFSFFGNVLTVCFPKFSKVRKTLRRGTTALSPPSIRSLSTVVNEEVDT